MEENIQEAGYDDIPITVMPPDTASEDGGDEADIRLVSILVIISLAFDATQHSIPHLLLP